eukprot:7687485-Ditylum_brightwellii.AAC.1
MAEVSQGEFTHVEARWLIACHTRQGEGIHMDVLCRRKSGDQLDVSVTTGHCWMGGKDNFNIVDRWDHTHRSKAS